MKRQKLSCLIIILTLKIIGNIYIRIKTDQTLD